MISLLQLLTEHDHAFSGPSRSGYPVVTVVDNRLVFKGSNLSGDPLYTIYRNLLFKGRSSSGSPLARMTDDMIFLGNAISGFPLARINKNMSFLGNSTSGSPLVTVPSNNIYTLFAATYHVLRGQ